MAFVRGSASGYVHSQAIALSTPFPACDGILVLTSGNPVITLKSGATVTLASVAANSVIPLAATLVTGTGTYVALYR
jgi:hypothetical protein